MAKPNFNSYRANYTYPDTGITLQIRKSSSGYGKWYVVTPEGRYLTRGASSLSGAQFDMARIHAELAAQAAEAVTA